jgi:tellurium resistance protein TerZ
MSISLTKGQKISLSKSGGAALQRVAMGLGWDAKKGLFGLGGSIDLDASCLLVDDQGNLLESVWFQQLRSRDGTVQHSGDNLTGAGEGDDEVITVNLAGLPANIRALVFTVNSFTGQTFKSVRNAYCRLVDLDGNQELARYDLSSSGDHTGQVMAKLYRHEGEWKMHAIGEHTNGRTFQDMLPMIRQNL